MSITKISPSVVDFDAGITISTTDNSTNLTLSSTDADANGGPILDFYRNSSSPADNDVLFQSNIYAENDADEKIAYGYINTFATDVSDGSESMKLNLNMYSAGTALNRLELSSSETVFNQDSGDIDFRVEGDGNTHALFVQASDDKVGIGVSDPGGLPLHLKVASGDNKLRQETAAKDAFTLGLDNSTGDTIIGTHTLYPAVRFLNAGGIAFGSDTAAANALNDYEEGTWTPTLVGCDSVDFSSHQGLYIKVGAMVHVQWYSSAFTVANPLSNNARIHSLPFTPKSGYYGSASFAHTTAFTNDEVQGWTNSSSPQVYVSNEGNTGGNNWSSGYPKYVMMSVVYYTDD